MTCFHPKAFTILSETSGDGQTYCPDCHQVNVPISPPPSLQIMRLSPEAKLPIRSTQESAGYDIHAFIRTGLGSASHRMVPPNTTIAIPTGLAVRPPPNHVVLVCSRSGLAMKSIFVANAPGVIDPDYTGELQILLFNGGFESYQVQHENRIAQLLVVPLTLFPLKEVMSVPQTGRGGKGIGSTGA